MGAEVIKIEDPEGGDYARMYPPLMSDGNSAIFHALNRGKKSVSLDLKQPKQMEQFIALLATADVLVETFRPGVMQKLGIAPAALLKRFPALIICSISGYGQTGPDALRAGHDINYLAKSGALGVMSRPSLLPVQVADIAGGSYPAAVQILAALRARDHNGGRGSVIDVSMTDNVYSLLTMPLARYAASAAPFSGGLDWLTGGTPCYEVYATADGWISVGALEPKFWAAFCAALNREDLISRQFPEAGPQVQEVKAEVASILSKQSSEHWQAFFKSKDCCVEIVARPEDVLARDAHLASRGLTLQLTFPPSADGGANGAAETLTCAKTPLRMTGVKCSEKPAPGLGEHNAQLLIKSKL